MAIYQMTYNELISLSVKAHAQNITIPEYTSQHFKATFFPPSDKRYGRSFGYLYFKNEKYYIIFLLKKDGILK